MTPNERHNLIAETEFRPYIEALLEGKEVEFKHNMNSTWRDLDLYTLVANNLSDYQFRFKPEYKKLSDELDLLISIHISETNFDRASSKKLHGKDEIELLEELGLLNFNALKSNLITPSFTPAKPSPPIINNITRTVTITAISEFPFFI